MGSCCTKYYVYKKEGTIPNVLGVEIDNMWEEEYFLYPEIDIEQVKICSKLQARS